MVEFTGSSREEDLRELHHFETEQENARLVEENRVLRGYRTEYDLLHRQMATPPPGWYPFGSHIDQPDVTLEFWGDEGGVPIWERPVLPGVEMLTVRGEGRWRYWRKDGVGPWYRLPGPSQFDV